MGTSEVPRSSSTNWLALGSCLAGFMFTDISINGNLQPTINIVKPANAEFRAAQKRTFFRFTPKFIEGMKFYKTDLKDAIDKEDFDVVKKMFNEYVVKKSDLVI